MEITHIDPHASWQGRPLCCRYLLVHFATRLIQARADSAAHSWSVTWALGALSDGHSEMLGVWRHSTEGVLNWQAVFDGLAVRGVEQIRFAIHVDAAFAQTTFPGLKALNTALPERDELEISAKHDAPRSTEICEAGNGRSCDPSELPRRVQVLARRTEEAVLLLQRGLRQAAIRHGPFESGSAAAAFAEAWLANAEHRHRRRRLATYRATGVGAAAPAQ
jgi:hypothetical protein